MAVPLCATDMQYCKNNAGGTLRLMYTKASLLFCIAICTWRYNFLHAGLVIVNLTFCAPRSQSFHVVPCMWYLNAKWWNLTMLLFHRISSYVTSNKGKNIFLGDVWKRKQILHENTLFSQHNRKFDILIILVNFVIIQLLLNKRTPNSAVNTHSPEQNMPLRQFLIYQVS